MAFASASMVATLVKDLKPVEGKITKLKAYAKDYDQSTLLVGIAGLDVPLVKCKPRIEKWERELKLKPPIFPDNDDYKSVRGELTKLIPDLVEALGGEGRSVTGEAPAATSRGGAVTGPAQAPVDTDPDSAPF